MAPNFNSLLASVVFDGLIVAVLAVAVLAIGFVLSKAGSASLVRFISSVAGAEQVKVRDLGYWDKDVYESAMRDLNRHKQAGGIMDSESREELKKWQFDNPDELKKRRSFSDEFGN